MIGAELDTKALEKAIAAFQKSDALIDAEFKIAGEQANKAIVRDLQGGVANVTGTLKSGITGELKSVLGTEIDMQISTTATDAGGYNYGGFLNAHGKPTWRGGKFKGHRTWGWFSWVLEFKLGKRFVRRY